MNKNDIIVCIGLLALGVAGGMIYRSDRVQHPENYVPNLHAEDFRNFKWCERCREIDSKKHPCEHCGARNSLRDWSFRRVEIGLGFYDWMYQQESGQLFVNCDRIHKVPERFTINEGRTYTRDQVTTTGYLAFPKEKVEKAAQQ